MMGDQQMIDTLLARPWAYAALGGESDRGVLDMIVGTYCSLRVFTRPPAPRRATVVFPSPSKPVRPPFQVGSLLALVFGQGRLSRLCFYGKTHDF